MAQKYFLPCPSCEQKNLVETTQAGQSLVCSGCGTSISIGTLRDIRALDSAETRVESSGSSHRTGPTMSAGSRALFVISTLLLVACGIFGTMQMIKAVNLTAEKPEVVMPPEIRKQFEAVSPKRMLALWEGVDVSSVSVWEEHKFLTQQKVASRARLLSYINFGLAGLGLLGIITAFLMPKTRTG